MTVEEKMKEHNSKKSAQLVETAKLLFFKHGVGRITIKEICEKSNVSKCEVFLSKQATVCVGQVWIVRVPLLS